MKEQNPNPPQKKLPRIFRIEYPAACQILTIVGGKRVSVFELLSGIPEDVLLEAAAPLKEMHVPN